MNFPIYDLSLPITDSSSSIMGRAMSYERRNEACVFHLSKDPVSVIPDAFAIKRNAPTKQYVDNMWVSEYCLCGTML